VERWTSLADATVEHRETLADQGVEAASVRVGDGRVELLRPLAADTEVGRFLEKRGPGMHQVAFEVDDVAAELARVRALGFELIDEEPRGACSGSVSPSCTRTRRAAFWQSSSLMNATERLRIEIAFEGSQVLTVWVPPTTADDLDRALAGAHDSLSFEAEDGRYTLAVKKIVYVKRFARESRVGFGAAA
jgi:methylmalonyl-CoA epimerase